MRIASLALSASERRKLRLYLNKVGDKATYVRKLSVYRVGLGEKPSVVAGQLEVLVRAVYKWVHLFLESRIPEVLVPAKRWGRPRGFTELTDSRILSVLELKPDTLGYLAGSWTVATLTYYLNRLYGTSISTIR